MRGFTLMEVLVALVILSLAFTTVFMGISTNARNQRYLQNKTAASFVALNAIAEAQLNPSDAAGNKQERMFDKTWYVTKVVKTTPNASVSQIDVVVSEGKNAKPLVQVTGYLRSTQ